MEESVDCAFERLSRNIRSCGRRTSSTQLPWKDAVLRTIAWNLFSTHQPIVRIEEKRFRVVSLETLPETRFYLMQNFFSRRGYSMRRILQSMFDFDNHMHFKNKMQFSRVFTVFLFQVVVYTIALTPTGFTSSVRKGFLPQPLQAFLDTRRKLQTDVDTYCIDDRTVNFTDNDNFRDHIFQLDGDVFATTCICEEGVCNMNSNDF